MSATWPRIAHGTSAGGTRRTDRVESCSPADGIGAAVKEKGTSARPAGSSRTSAMSARAAYRVRSPDRRVRTCFPN